MFRSIPYSDQELRIIGENKGRGGATPIRNTPVSRRENMEALYTEKKPYWIPVSSEMGAIIGCWDQHLARGTGADFLDDFGIQWVYEPVAGGSIVRGDMPQLLDDVNNWKEKVHIPDPDTWDWEGAAEKSTCDLSRMIQANISNGFWFERLISFMGFMNAAMALIDDEQTDAIKELFQAMTDMGCKVIDKYCEYFPGLDIFTVHDDWGSQKDPFFSEEVARELFLPYMKQLTAHVHSKGRLINLHSCGHNFSRIQIFVEAGFDSWTPQPMNDIKTLYKEWGDKIVLGVIPSDPALLEMDEEGQRQAAREFVDFYSEPGKPITVGASSMAYTTPAFLEEIYIYSRKKYAERG